MFYILFCADHLIVQCDHHHPSTFQYLLCDLLLGLLQQSHHSGTSVCSTVALQHDLGGGSNLWVLRVYSLFANNGTIVDHAIRRACRHDFEVLFSRIQRLSICFLRNMTNLSILALQVGCYTCTMQRRCTYPLFGL